MGARWLRAWSGGRVREVDGREVFVIERRIGGGQRRVISLDVASERDALAELALFERDPSGYRTRAQSTADCSSLAISKPLIDEFLIAKALEKTTEAYREYLRGYLADWAADIGRRDLRQTRLSDLRAALTRHTTAKHKRIVALRSLTAWLREEGRLERRDDPSIDLKVPQHTGDEDPEAVPEQGYSPEFVARFYAEVSSQVLRDVLCLRAKTGMHDTEIGRIARGKAVLRRVKDASGIAGTITFMHLKKGSAHIVAVDDQAFAAAERLRARGRPLSRNAAKVMLDRAAVRLGLDPEDAIKPGQLRHSFATWARQSGEIVRPANLGVADEEIARQLGHTSTRMVRETYIKDHVPPMILVPVRLVHPKDPVSLRAARSESTG